MATQAERRSATRSAILRAATECFAARGYVETTVTEILEAAGVSRGAMYHHYKSKEDVLAAVFLKASSEAIQAAIASVPGNLSPKDALIAGVIAWLDEATTPAVAQILLVEGPAGLGWARSRTLEEQTSLGLMRASITAAVDSGELYVSSVDAAARLVNALAAEAAVSLHAEPSSEVREQMAHTITAMINGLGT